MKRYKVYTKERGLVETNDYHVFNLLTWHREDGPAYIEYYDNGIKQRECYYINGVSHRLCGPSAICYYKNGNLDYLSYWINGNRNRMDGPAYISYDKYGNIQYVGYWINGIEYTKEQYDKELLKLKLQSL